MAQKIPATPRQKAYMRRLGLQFPADIDKEEASYRISKRKNMLPMGKRQRQAIERLGGRIDRPLLRFQAELFQQALESLWEDNDLCCPECGEPLLMTPFALHGVCRECGTDLERTNPKFTAQLAGVGIRPPESLFRIRYDTAYDRRGELREDFTVTIDPKAGGRSRKPVIPGVYVAVITILAIVVMLIVLDVLDSVIAAIAGP